MPFLQPTAITALLRFPSAFARLQRAVKARMDGFPFFELRVTVSDGALLSSTRKGKSHFTSPCMKRRSLFSPLKSSPPISSPRSSGKPSSSQNPVNVEAGNESPIILIDTNVAPPSPVCVPVLLLPPPVGTKIIDRFWPEADAEHSDRDEALWKGAPASPVNVLAPPPYHRRSHSADVLSSDVSHSHYTDRRDSLPLRFPF
ncbi:hypothetical protein K503DRAFT_800649 [Rhizopogon vinicolor AM-OR11-026]|uniref:Uncharacterized protein n=1 Tax=Rhizopogon vinicolor AM-OR11-026 TaxID=1314800 RepID=A0A1B7MZZ1_9AGAM|nr:hypothetical protein K503DRAFT_800649 [Rhizopogon vinicolor AM-OR11-026]